MTFFRMVLAVLALMTISQAEAQIRPETRWADPDQAQLHVEFPGDGYHANWDVWRCECGDLLVKSELAVPDEQVSGDLVLVSRRGVLSRGFGKYKAEAAASLDAAALMLQLTLRLLERSEPGGPGKISQPTPVTVEDGINPILLDTGAAAGGFQAPWSVNGTISPGQGNRRNFDLTFEFSVRTATDVQEGSMRLAGWLDFSEIEFPLSPQESLQGWNLDWRDPGDAAAGAVKSAKTLAELREKIKNN